LERGADKTAAITGPSANIFDARIGIDLSEVRIGKSCRISPQRD
jgi:hypothetical protein